MRSGTRPLLSVIVTLQGAMPYKKCLQVLCIILESFNCIQCNFIFINFFNLLNQFPIWWHFFVFQKTLKNCFKLFSGSWNIYIKRFTIFTHVVIFTYRSLQVSYQTGFDEIRFKERKHGRGIKRWNITTVCEFLLKIRLHTCLRTK